jgi:glycerophosphoryl diester phosphodiesterase
MKGIEEAAMEHGSKQARFPERCLIVAHRGASGRAPENTADSFRLAATFEADAAETDVRRTRDGSLVLIHDETVDRTSNGMGRVCDLDLADLLRLDAGSWFGPGFEGESLLTFDEGLRLLKSLKLRPVIEIKETETCPDVANRLQEYEMTDECHVVSFLPEAIAAMRKAAPGVTATLILDPRSPLFRQSDPLDVIAGAVTGCGADGAGLFHMVVTRELVIGLHERGIPVSLLLLDREEEIRKGLALGVEAILTDFPDRARRLMREYTAGLSTEGA